MNSRAPHPGISPVTERCSCGTTDNRPPQLLDTVHLRFHSDDLTRKIRAIRSRRRPPCFLLTYLPTTEGRHLAYEPRRRSPSPNCGLLRRREPSERATTSGRSVTTVRMLVRGTHSVTHEARNLICHQYLLCGNTRRQFLHNKSEMRGRFSPAMPGTRLEYLLDHLASFFGVGSKAGVAAQPIIIDP